MNSKHYDTLLSQDTITYPGPKSLQRHMHVWDQIPKVVTRGRSAHGGCYGDVFKQQAALL